MVVFRVFFRDFRVFVFLCLVGFGVVLVVGFPRFCLKVWVYVRIFMKDGEWVLKGWFWKVDQIG